MRFVAMSTSHIADRLENSFSLETSVLRELYAYCW